jgi:hypothetical protein
MAISDWIQRLRRPGPEHEFTLGWGDFPPLHEGATESEVESYLDRCRFGAAAVDTEN